MKGFLILFFFFSSLNICLGDSKKYFLNSFIEESAINNADKTILITNVKDKKSIKQEAKILGINVKGKEVLSLTGAPELLQLLSVDSGEEVIFIEDQAFSSTGLEEYLPEMNLDQEIFYLAKKDFGLVEFLKKHPTFDGRGVITGVIDDGFSPHQSGFIKTSDGKRKLIGHYARSSYFQTIVSEVTDDQEARDYLKSLNFSANKKFQGIIYEQRWNFHDTGYDLNGDGNKTEIDAVVFQDQNSEFNVCIDVNINKTIDPGECFKTFNKTGEYGFWDQDKMLAIMAEFDSTKRILKFSQGERRGDSHGEGCASVMAGHQIGGKFDGVAPGAQIVDYDLRETTNNVYEIFYTLGSFLKGLEVLGEAGAEVINISYSLYFTSAKTQEFMKQAIDNLIEKYKFVITFSAGNNGPGLGSLNRRSIYPENSLVAGAFASKELDEYVHGVSGLPEEGRVIYYSSIGPGPKMAEGPTVISPLASLTHASASNGYQAFSGTSSASPALAGFAAVLVSAVKQNNLRVDVSAVVNAIRLSGEPLPNVPFLVQGYGLPKIERALGIYKRIISGKDFARVRGFVAGVVGPDQIETRGILIKRSQVDGDYIERKVKVVGILADSVDKSIRTDLLKTFRLEYSHDFITGPSRGWLSVNAKNLFITVDLNKAFAKESVPNEIFGEIKLYDDETGDLIHIIPVTIINDIKLENPREFQLEVGPEEGKRIHLFIPPGISGFRVKSELIQGEERHTDVKIYNPSHVSIIYRSLKNGSDLFVETNFPGHYQVTFLKRKGGSGSSIIKTTISPIQMELKTRMISLATPQIAIDNHRNNSEELKVILKRGYKLLTTRLVTFPENALGVSSSVPIKLNTAGKYLVNLKTAEDTELAYGRINCLAQLRHPNGRMIRQKIFSTSLELLPQETTRPAVVNFFCTPFDKHDKKNFASTHWVMKIYFQESGSEIFDKIVVKLKSGRNVIKPTWSIEKPKVGDEISVYLAPIFNSDDDIYLESIPVEQ